MVKDLYETTKYTKTQLKFINVILKNGVNDLKKKEDSFKSGREEYQKIHENNNFLLQEKIDKNVFMAKIISIMLSLYLLVSLFYLDIYGLLFAIVAYYAIIVIVLQYELWINHYKCIINFRTYLKQTVKDKTLWLWYINNKYKE